jgi:hypothetical protein
MTYHRPAGNECLGGFIGWINVAADLLQMVLYKMDNFVKLKTLENELL